jgi:hypothetical protein
MGISTATLIYDYEFTKNKSVNIAIASLSAFKTVVLVIITLVGVLFFAMKDQVKHR